MDPAMMSAVAALAGSTIGGLTMMATSWLGQRVQFTTQQLALHQSRQEELYRMFIEEASRWYADAYEHDTPEVSNLVNLYALVSRMRVFSSARVVEQADRVVRAIIEAYLAPNKTFVDIHEILDNVAMNPLHEFSMACREELAMRGHRPAGSLR
jgi:hypothetical protein